MNVRQQQVGLSYGAFQNVNPAHFCIPNVFAVVKWDAAVAPSKDNLDQTLQSDVSTPQNRSRIANDKLPPRPKIAVLTAFPCSIYWTHSALLLVEKIETGLFYRLAATDIINNNRPKVNYVTFQLLN